MSNSDSGSALRSTKWSWPYLIWDAVVLVAALLTVVGFVVVEDVPADFLNNLALQISIGLISALGVYVTMRVSVPNLAVPGIFVVAPLVGVKVVGAEGSTAVLIVVSVLVGVLVGLVLVGLVVVVRVPAWGATLVVAGILTAFGFRLVEDGGLIRVGERVSVVDWGIPLLVVSGVVAVSVAVGSLFVPHTSRQFGDGLLAQRRDATTIVVQSGALIVSSVLAAVAGVVVTLRIGVADVRSGQDLLVPLSILFLGGASLRGNRTGVVSLVAAAVVVETAALWSTFRDGSSGADRLLVVGGLGLLGLVVGALLDWLDCRTERRIR
jgi:ribose transport system permease protein